MTKEQIIIIALIVVIIYLAYQQNNQANISDNHQTEQLQQEVQHYQTLYQKRVERDTEYSPMIEKKVSDLETALLNLAKQKLKGKKEASELLANLEQNWTQEKVNLTNELTQAKQAITNLSQELTKKTQTINQQLTQINDKNNLITRQKGVLEQLLRNREERLNELGEAE